MSSIRIDSLRLVWLETFLQVAESENISEAARELSCDQSTVTRHLQALQKWAGKKLYETSKMHDPDDPGVNVKITEDGTKLFCIAKCLTGKLTDFRAEEAKAAEILGRMNGMIAKMRTDLESKKPSRTVLSVKDKVEFQTKTIAEMTEKTPLQAIEAVYPYLRRFFATYEDQLNRERRKPSRKGKRSAKGIDMSQIGKPPLARS